MNPPDFVPIAICLPTLITVLLYIGIATKSGDFVEPPDIKNINFKKDFAELGTKF